MVEPLPILLGTESVVPGPVEDIGPITVDRAKPLQKTTVAPVRARANNTPTTPKVLDQTTDTPQNTPDQALDTAAPINSNLPSAYLFQSQVLVDGTNLGPPVSFEVTCNCYYQADRYYTELAVAALPTGNQKDFWSGGDQKKLEIRCGIKNMPAKSLIIGLIDDLEIDWLTNTVKIRGRDLSSLLMDNKTAEKFPNKTSSDVATLLATRHGMSSQVTKTTTLVGTYFQREHAKITSDVSEHDLLTFLAEQEGFNYWVEGNVLHFEQPPPENTKPFVVRYAAPTASTIANGTFISLVTKRSETLAKDFSVKVVSWDAKKKRVVTAEAKRSRTAKVSGGINKKVNTAGGLSQPYIARIPGLTKEQAQARANKIAEDISKHERSVVVEMPFDPVVDARTRLSLRGTGTEFDQAYYIEAIEYSGSFEAGSRMEIHAKNTSPQSIVTI